MLAKFLSAMASAAVGYGRAGYLLDGPHGPGRLTPALSPLPRWHPDNLMLPPLTDTEREIFDRLTTFD
jgi:hypothetical protein